MILTICPNPSVDCTIELDSLNVGMLNRIDSKVETYSGKALNVAMGVARLGEKCHTTGFMFDDQGKLFEHVLDREGVKHNFIYNKGRARVNYKIIDKRSMLTEINDKGETVTRDKQLELIDYVQRVASEYEIIVMSGSLPKGVDPSFYKEVLSVIPKNVKVIVDTEKENMLSAVKGCNLFMAKPNLREIENFTGRSLLGLNEIVDATKRYTELGVQNVLVSLGSDGAILTDGRTSYYCKSANVAVNSTVGAGDCMVAAVCVGLLHNVPMPELLRMSVAAGTAAVTTSGTNLFYKDKYNEIYSKIFSQKM